MEEMRQLIGRRQIEVDSTPRRVRPQSVYDAVTKNGVSTNTSDATRSIEASISEIDENLAKAASYQGVLQNDLKQVSIELKEVCFFSYYSSFKRIYSNTGI
jgi:hypothetical protein